MANPYLPNWEYIPDGEPRVLEIEYIFTVLTIKPAPLPFVIRF